MKWAIGKSFKLLKLNLPGKVFRRRIYRRILDENLKWCKCTPAAHRQRAISTQFPKDNAVFGEKLFPLRSTQLGSSQTKGRRRFPTFGRRREVFAQQNQLPLEVAFISLSFSFLHFFNLIFYNLSFPLNAIVLPVEWCAHGNVIDGTRKRCTARRSSCTRFETHTHTHTQPFNCETR